MRKILLSSLAAASLLSACGPKNEVDIEPIQVKTETQGYDLARQYRKFAEVQMNPDTSFLAEGERQAVNKIIEASKLLSEVYLRQLDVRNPEIRAEIEASGRPDKDLLLQMFDLHFSVCDGLEDGHVFYGDTPCPVGAGFYPADMTKQEFEDHIAAAMDLVGNSVRAFKAAGIIFILFLNRQVLFHVFEEVFIFGQGR